MAIPLLLTLAPRVRSLLPVIESGVAKGLSSKAINQAIINIEGRGIRRQTLLDVMRSVKGVQQSRSILKFLTLDSRPNVSRLPEAITRTRRKLSYVVQVVGRNPFDNSLLTQRVTVATDSNMTRREIEDMAASFIDSGQSGSAVEIEDMQLISGVRAGSLGTLTQSSIQ